MKGIGYFQNLRNLLRNFLEIFWNFLRNFFGGIFWEKFFGRNYLVEVNKELMFLSRFWGNFVSMHRKKEGRRNFNP
jgi:hypothetical protein